jgi:peptide-methionine (S)-S-oxide reductase
VGALAPASTDPIERKIMAVATFAAGCFWGVEQRFAALPGVTRTEVGYTGGSTPHPTYKQVCSHGTGHAEAVRLEYDPQHITYERLLEAFFEMHDPTTPDRQGPDVGSQYRSAIFYHSPEQEAAAREFIARLESSAGHRDPIVTEVAEAPEFWRAEEYHQRYFEKHRVWGCTV